MANKSWDIFPVFSNFEPNFLKMGRNTNKTKTTKISKPKIVQRILESISEERAITTTIANRIQPVTSSMAAQAREMDPMGVLISFLSERILAKTGNAVILIAVPINIAKIKKETLSFESCG